MPKFSIVVPVYNVEREYLEAALNSMLAQSYTDWECICVDDGSTNDSGKVLDEFAAKDPRFKVHHRINQGVSAARNFALEKVTGEWIMFMDGDDLLSVSALSEVKALTIKYPSCKIFRFWYELISEKQNWTSSNANYVDGIFHLTEMFPISFSCALPVWGFAFNASTIKNIKFPAFRMGEDTLFTLECLKLMKDCGYTTKKLYGYRQRSTSVCHSISPRTHLDYFNSLVLRLKLFSDDKRGKFLYDSPCLVRILSHDYVIHTSRTKDDKERKKLWDAWFNALGFLSSREEFAAPYRHIFKICRATQSRFISYFLCGITLAIAWRIRLPFAKSIHPDAESELTNKFISADGVSVPGIQA